MSAIGIWLSRAWLAAVMAVSGMVALPPTQVTSHVAATPTASQGNYVRLQNAWERQQGINSRLGWFFDHIEERVAKGQEMIDKAKANGKDVAALQASLDAFAAAVKQGSQCMEVLKA